MGLDQYAYTRKPDQKPEDVEPQFVWRKHAKLQEWAEQLFVEKTEAFADQLNCNELILDLDDIEALERLVQKNALPESEGGFFYGHQFQDESAKEYRAQDLEFCAWAKALIKDGHIVYYSCWW